MRFLLLLVPLLAVVLGCSDSATDQPAASVPSIDQSVTNRTPQVGFFAPGRVNEAFADQVDMQLYNLSTPEHFEATLKLASVHGLKIFAAIELPARLAAELSLTYQYKDKVYDKQLAPFPVVKLRNPINKEAFAVSVAPYFALMKQYPRVVEALIIGDEPYLNGISYAQLDAMALTLRSLLDEAGLDAVKLGAVFASAMFNAEFAQHIETASSAYTRGIDDYFLHLQAKESRGEAAAEELQWLDVINRVRLTTYDKANNMFLGGGLPSSLDIVGFDFYFSTLLQDGVHNESLAWFAARNLHPSCEVFKETKMTELRESLSFWGKSLETTDLKADLKADKSLLDAMYTCRTASALVLLKKEIAASDRKAREVVLVSESSANGLMAFDKQGGLLPEQDMEAVKSRVVDEVGRAFNLTQGYSIDHLLFFTYESQFDWLINLTIEGAEDIPEALHLIYQNARRNHEPLPAN